MIRLPIRLQKKKIERFCKENHILSMALFGSILTPKFSKKSDVDILINFEKKHIPHLLSFIQMEFELSNIIGYPVDLKTINDLSPYFREDVLANAKFIYGE